MPVPAVRIFSIPAAKRHLAYAGRHAAICHGVAGIEYFFFCIAPSLRIALSIGGLFGVVSFSLTGFSFPAEAMYPAFHLLTDILPLRHYFIIYADQALNGVPFYYSRMHYMALFIYILLALPFLPLLKRALRKQVYIA